MNAEDAESRVPVIHVAAPPNQDGSQDCARCGIVLHKARTGAPPPWYPGQLVSEHPQAMASIRYAPLGWPQCLPRPSAA